MRFSTIVSSFLLYAASASAARWSLSYYSKPNCEGGSIGFTADDQPAKCEDFDSIDMVKSVKGEPKGDWQITWYVKPGCNEDGQHWTQGGKGGAAPGCLSNDRGDTPYYSSYKVLLCSFPCSAR